MFIKYIQYKYILLIIVCLKYSGPDLKSVALDVYIFKLVIQIKDVYVL